MQAENQLSLCDEKGEIDRARRPWEIIPPGHKIGTPTPLFKELVYPVMPNFFYLLWIINLFLGLCFSFGSLVKLTPIKENL